MSKYDCLIRGDEYLEQHPGFQLSGRDEELKDLHAILMRSKSNSCIIVGPGGVGASALCMGLESEKDDPDTPLDIVSKRKFWLDTDALFASGDASDINETFKRLTGRLARIPNSVLIIDDMNDFIEGARSNGCSNLINSLMRDIKANKYQAVLESRDEDLGAVLKCHSDMTEIFTTMDLSEPEADNLEAIAKVGILRLEKHHGIKVSPEAVEAALEVTSKYRANDASLSRAQPERCLTLLDRALTKYRQISHSRAPELDELENRLADVMKAQSDEYQTPDSMQGKSPEELEALKASLESDIQEVTEAWEVTRNEIRRLHKEQLDAEKLIRDKEDEIAKIKEEELERRKEIDSLSEGADNSDLQSSEGTIDVSDFVESARDGGFDSPAVKELREKIDRYQTVAAESRAKYDELMQKVNEKLLLTKDHVLHRFSKLSGIPVSRLGQDEREKLRNLDKELMGRVFAQDDASKAVANSVKAARVGLRDRNKPMGSFIFIGPSGVGKTELAKALAMSLYEDERALLRLDMSEYQEKHAMAKLIGAPPGYEGFEAGGYLTNEMRKNPRRIVLMDEIEKAHPDVFDLCLQMVDDARLSDNVGRVCSFADSVIILTSNIGSHHFLDPDLPYEEAVELATQDLEEKFRPEFLNRFNGRRNIRFFNALPLSAIQKIVAREFGKINGRIAENGLAVDMRPEDLEKMCEAMYRPKDGARGVQGFVNDFMDENLSNTILETPDAQGIMLVTFDPDSGKMSISPPAANDQNPPSPVVTPGADFDEAVS